MGCLPTYARITAFEPTGRSEHRDTRDTWDITLGEGAMRVPGVPAVPADPGEPHDGSRNQGRPEISSGLGSLPIATSL